VSTRSVSFEHKTDSLRERWLALPWDAVVAHVSEIALKGRNRGEFFSRLRRNLHRALGDSVAHVGHSHRRLELYPAAGRLAEVLQRAAQVMGVAYVVPVRFLPLNLELLEQTAVEIYRAVAQPAASFAVRVRRRGVDTPLNSTEMERRIGAAVVKATGAPVNLDAPDVLIAFRMYAEGAWLLGPRFDGPAGLPVGSVGSVLTLFSGGIDSPVAAWLMMRRGCATDFLHFHSYGDPERVRETKLIPILEQLLGPQAVPARLFLAPYDLFQLRLLQRNVPRALELVLFRRFMMRLADRLAARHGYQAIVTGDNLGQVASQTMESLIAVDEVVTRPVFRPLLAHNKTEIIALAERIGTYVHSIRPYKDCCSLLARHPATRPALPAVHAAESRLDIEELLQRTEQDMVEIEVGGHELRSQKDGAAAAPMEHAAEQTSL
jgi:thiamine biosynthesis protein ThiI